MEEIPHEFLGDEKKSRFFPKNHITRTTIALEEKIVYVVISNDNKTEKQLPNALRNLGCGVKIVIFGQFGDDKIPEAAKTMKMKEAEEGVWRLKWTIERASLSIEVIERDFDYVEDIPLLIAAHEWMVGKGGCMIIADFTGVDLLSECWKQLGGYESQTVKLLQYDRSIPEDQIMDKLSIKEEQENVLVIQHTKDDHLQLSDDLAEALVMRETKRALEIWERVRGLYKDHSSVFASLVDLLLSIEKKEITVHEFQEKWNRDTSTLWRWMRLAVDVLLCVGPKEVSDKGKFRMENAQRLMKIMGDKMTGSVNTPPYSKKEIDKLIGHVFDEIQRIYTLLEHRVETMI